MVKASYIHKRKGHRRLHRCIVTIFGAMVTFLAVQIHGVTLEVERVKPVVAQGHQVKDIALRESNYPTYTEFPIHQKASSNRNMSPLAYEHFSKGVLFMQAGKVDIIKDSTIIPITFNDQILKQRFNTMLKQIIEMKDIINTAPTFQIVWGLRGD